MLSSPKSKISKTEYKRLFLALQDPSKRIPIINLLFKNQNNQNKVNKFIQSSLDKSINSTFNALYEFNPKLSIENMHSALNQIQLQSSSPLDTPPVSSISKIKLAEFEKLYILNKQNALDEVFSSYSSKILIPIQAFMGLDFCDTITSLEQDFFKDRIKLKLDNILHSYKNDVNITNIASLKQNIVFSNQMRKDISQWNEAKLDNEIKILNAKISIHKILNSRGKDLIEDLEFILENINCENVQSVKYQIGAIKHVFKKRSIYFYNYNDYEIEKDPELKNLFYRINGAMFPLPIVCIKNESNLELYGNTLGYYL